jgi:clan AA aspartic protease (TIGR02281 family)
MFWALGIRSLAETAEQPQLLPFCKPPRCNERWDHREKISRMSQLFTVRWPIFARLEAVLLFPAAAALASGIEPVRTLVNRGIVPALSPFGDRLGIPNHAISPAAMATIVVVPYFFVLLMADRFLTIRKGYAVLSIIAIAVWAAVGQQLSWLLIDLTPESKWYGTDWLSIDQEVALAAGGLALLLNCRPLWIGLRDRGDVAMRLVDVGYAYGRRDASQGPRTQDVYYLRTASFREWRPKEELGGHGSGRRENSAVKLIYAITWIGVIAGIGTAYLSGAGYLSHRDPSASNAKTGSLAAAGARPAPPSSIPVVQVAPGAAMGGSRVVVTPALPSVQRPGELSGNTQTASMMAGANEAVTERGNDGGFTFDAVMNGAHVRMLFDTGAATIGLRAEDAERAGIALARLNYSAKARTANGIADVAPVMIDTITIGNITLRNVLGFVAKEGMLHENLLGQTFLSRLSGFNVEKNLLVLKGR